MCKSDIPRKPHSLLVGQKPTREEVFCGLLPGFDNEEIAEKGNAILCKGLIKGNSARQILAARISRCSASSPCGSGSCRLCMRDARMQVVPQASIHIQQILKEEKELARVRKDPQSKRTLWSVSAVDYRMAVPRGSLDADAVRRKSEAVAKALQRALPGTVAFAGVDIGLNVPLPKGSRPEWQPQLYFVLTAHSSEEVHAVLDPLFPRKPHTDEKPVRVDKLLVKNLPSATTYAFKSVFTRRVSYHGNNGRLQTRKVWLKPDEATELAVFLDQLGIKERLLLRGLKIIKGQLIRT